MVEGVAKERFSETLMSVSREEVIWAYRMILGREPESDTVINAKIGLESVPQMRTDMLLSDEFAQIRPGIQVGLHLDVRDDLINIDCTSDQRQRMLDRIAAAWAAFGAEQPFWSVLTADQFRQDEVDQHLDDFYATGATVIDQLIALLGRNRIDPGKIRRVLDFGCGVGRLSFALAQHFEHVNGADISQPHLQLANAWAKNHGIANVAFAQIDSISNVKQLPECDLLFSYIVLQHNPPPMIFDLLDSLLSLVAIGGYAFFQVPTFIAGFEFDADYYLSTDQPQMEMNALPQRHIFNLAARRGFVPVEVREGREAGDARMVSQTFLLKRER